MTLDADPNADDGTNSNGRQNPDGGTTPNGDPNPERGPNRTAGPTPRSESAVEDLLAERTQFASGGVLAYAIGGVAGVVAGLVVGSLLSSLFINVSQSAEYSGQLLVLLVDLLRTLSAFVGAVGGIYLQAKRGTKALLYPLSCTLAAFAGAILTSAVLSGLIPTDTQWARGYYGEMSAVLLLLGVLVGVTGWNELYRRVVRPRATSLPEPDPIVGSRVGRRGVLLGVGGTIAGLQGMAHLSDQNRIQHENVVTTSDSLEVRDLTFGLTDAGDEYRVAGTLVNVTDEPVTMVDVSVEFFDSREYSQMTASVLVPMLLPDERKEFSLSASERGMVSVDVDDIAWFELEVEENYRLYSRSADGAFD